MATPKKNVAYDFAVTLASVNLPGKFVTDPTISVGDFKARTDYGTLSNLTTLPVVVEAGAKEIKISLSAAEMNGSKVAVIGSDPDDAWDDIYIFLDVPETNEIDSDIIRKIVQNDQVVNKLTSKMEILDDAGAVIEFEAPIYQDNGTTPWTGTGPIIRRGKFVSP